MIFMTEGLPRLDVHAKRYLICIETCLESKSPVLLVRYLLLLIHALSLPLALALALPQAPLALFVLCLFVCLSAWLLVYL